MTAFEDGVGGRGAQGGYVCGFAEGGGEEGEGGVGGGVPGAVGGGGVEGGEGGEVHCWGHVWGWRWCRGEVRWRGWRDGFVWFVVGGVGCIVTDCSINGGVPIRTRGRYPAAPSLSPLEMSAQSFTFVSPS